MKSKSAFQLVRTGSRAACILAAATAALLSAHSVHAATFVWANSNVTGATPATSLNWFNATQGAWSPSTPVSGNTNTIQFFQDVTTALGNTGGSGNSQTSVIDNGGSPFQIGTLTLSGLASATTGANLAMTISGDALDFSGATGRINLDALNATRTLTYNLNSNIQLGTVGSGSALTLAGNGTGTFNIGGIISELQSGGGSLIKNGSSTVSLTGANTYTGATTVNAGILNLSGNGSIATSTGLTLNGGGLTLTNTTTAEGGIDRVGAVGITSNGGTITYNNTSAANTYAEVLGAVTLTTGQLNVVSTNAATAGGTETLTLGAGSLTHAAANTSAITFSGASLGAGITNSIIVTSQATTDTGTIIGPWATFGTTAVLQSDYATYNITGGVSNAYGIQNANIAATTDVNWMDSTKAYTSNVGGALALVASTHNMLGLRNTGATTVMTIPLSLIHI